MVAIGGLAPPDSKRSDHLVTDLTSVKQGKATTVQDRSAKCLTEDHLVTDSTAVKQGKATTVPDRSAKCLTEERQILNRCREYCSEFYNYKANEDPSVLNCTQTGTEDDHPILRREAEAADHHHTLRYSLLCFR